MTSRYLTADDVADELRVSRSRAYEIMHEIPHIKLGRVVRVERVVFDSYRRSGRIERVYFIASGDDGPIKIGRAFDLRERLMRLQIGNPEILRILGWIYGGLREEQQLHERFERHYLRGEWFARVPALLEHIAEHARTWP